MNHWMKMATAAGFAFGLATAQTDDQAEQVSKLKNDIARLKKEIQRATSDISHTDSLTRDENAAAAQNLDRWQKDRERREKENQDLNNRIRETRGKIAAEQSRMQSYLNQVEEINARDKALLKIFSAFADSLVTRIENGPTWDLETRKDRVLSLKRDIDAGSAAPEEIFGRLSAIFKEEIKTGDEVALFNRPITRQNGEIVNAQIMKLGNLALIYMDDEDKKFGVLERKVENGKPVYAWREGLSFEEKNSVKLALTVKAGREAPQLVSLDLPLSIDSASTLKGGR